eukprot:GEMP01094036.1.p1 GENE.GEMP01094036.1~~GEMP01094036.1.p1  ORF type:complete len:120 (+),score=18.40 GEMP01094036.1:130-489(+)
MLGWVFLPFICFCTAESSSKVDGIVQRVATQADGRLMKQTCATDSPGGQKGTCAWELIDPYNDEDGVDDSRGVVETFSNVMTEPAAAEPAAWWRIKLNTQMTCGLCVVAGILLALSQNR